MYQKITYYSRISQTLHVPVPVAAGFTPTSAESAAWLARATNVTLDADKTAYDTMITGLVNDGVWAKLDCLYIFAAVDRTTAKLNLISSNYPCLENGTVNFTAYRGYIGNGGGAADFFLDSQFDPTTAGGNWTTSDASGGAYVISDIRSGAAGFALGSNFAALNWFLRTWNFGLPVSVWSGPALTASTGISSNGFWILSTVGGTVTYYNFGTINGANGAEDSQPDTAAGIPQASQYIFAINTGAGASGYSLDEISAAFLGGGLTGADVTNLKNRLNTFMTVYGIQQY